MKNRTVLQILGVAVLLGLFWQGLFASEIPKSAMPHPGSAGPQGLRALARVLERLDPNTAVSAKSYDSLRETGSVLVLPMHFWFGLGNLLQKLKESFDEEKDTREERPEGDPEVPPEVRALFEFIERGNTVVLPLDGKMGSIGFDTSSALKAAFGWVSKPSVSKESTTALAGQIRVKEPMMTVIQGFPPESQVVIGESSAPFAVAVPYEAGRVIALATMTPWSNDELRSSEGNITSLAELLLAERKGGRVIFDTYQLGERETNSPLALAWAPEIRTVTVHFVLAIALLIAATAVRFGAIRDPERVSGHSQLESARGIAGLFRRGRRPHLALNAILRGFETRLRSATGLGPDANMEEVTKRGAPLAGLKTADLSELFTIPNHVTDAMLLQRSARVVSIERQLRRDHTSTSIS